MKWGTGALWRLVLLVSLVALALSCQRGAGDGPKPLAETGEALSSFPDTDLIWLGDRPIEQSDLPDQSFPSHQRSYPSPHSRQGLYQWLRGRLRSDLPQGLPAQGGEFADLVEPKGGSAPPSPGSLPEVIELQSLPEPAEGDSFAASEFILTFEPGTTPAEVRQLMERFGLWLINDLSKADHNPTVYLVATADHPAAGVTGDRLKEAKGLFPSPPLIDRTSPHYPSLRQLMEEVLAQPEVANVGFNVALKLALVPDDPLYGNQVWLPGPLGTEPAWDISTGSSSIVIAIIDTGVSFSHPDLGPKIDTANSMDFWQQNDPGTNGDASCSGHGTGVAGMAAAIGNNSLGVASPDWNSTIVSLRIAEGNTCTLFISSSTEALNHIASVNSDNDPTNDIDVANMSYGSSTYVAADAQAANSAYNSGALLVAAAGNWDINNDEQPFYPCYYGSVACTSATNPNYQRAVWGGGQASHYGTQIEYAGQGQSTLTACYSPQTDQDGYCNFGGTSAASPSAAGVATLGWSVDQSVTNAQLRKLVHDTGINIDPYNPQFAGLLGRHVHAERLLRTLKVDTSYEPNDSISEAVALELDTPYSSWLSSSSDPQDWYSFNLREGNLLQVVLDWTNIAVNIDLKLYQTDGTLIADGIQTDEAEEQLTYKAPQDMTVVLQVQALYGGRAAYDFTAFQLAPEIDSVSPSVAHIGDEIVISGSKFGSSPGGDDLVRFYDGIVGWVEATEYTSWSDTEIRVKVPRGAQNGVDGVQVVVDGETSNAEPFAIIPTIQSVDSNKEYTWGDEVEIIGVGFGLSRGGSTVVFHNDTYGDTVAANDEDFLVWEDDRIVVKVPAGSHDGTITVVREGNESDPAGPLTILLPPPTIELIDQF